MQGPDAPFTPSREVDRVGWFPLAQARSRLDHQGDTYAIDAMEPLEARVTRIGAVLLVRNGHAVPPRHWAGSDRDRPLSTRGQEQAHALRQTLPAFMPARLLAAPQVRSLDTIRPLGADLGLPVEAEPALAEETYAARPHDGLARMKDLASAGPMTAVCASGAVIRHLIAALAADGGLWLEEVRAKKGSVWALFFSSCRLAAADYYPAMTSASG